MAVLQEGAFGGATLSLVIVNSRYWRDHPPDDGLLGPTAAGPG